MNRRNFLKYLGFGSAVAVAPSIVAAKTGDYIAPKAVTWVMDAHQSLVVGPEMTASEVLKRQREFLDRIADSPLIGPTEFKGRNWLGGTRIWSEPIDISEYSNILK